MAYGKSNGHVLDDVACAGLLILLIRNRKSYHTASRMVTRPERSRS